MQVLEFWLSDFRSYESAHLQCPEGLLAIVGPNGMGKSNLLEAIGYLATLGSFRGAPPDALIRAGTQSAVLRARVSSAEREHLIEAEIVQGRPNRVQVDHQRLRRTRDLLGTLRVSVFSPDDLSLVKGSPGLRREFLDDLAVALHPRNDDVRSTWEKALRQRNALLKQVAGRLDESALRTLEVWDSKAHEAGTRLMAIRAATVDALAARVAAAYRAISGSDQRVTLEYRPSCATELLAELVAARETDLRRRVTTVGPHRDDVVISLEGLPTRTHASQGEQRCVALSLRLAGHLEVAEVVGSPPVLLLDDVFSELDPQRCEALVRELPAGQAFLTTASGLPDVVDAERVVEVTGAVLDA
ncbi:MAG: DNA replication/repair protein RecF [Microthrixaceae bacterium]